MTQIMGILNLTPDSFSDGGQVTDIAAAVERMMAKGADVIDVGAESTRPGATPLTPDAEWARLEPFFADAFPRFRDRIPFSLDTRHAETAERALEAGISWINDVSGLSDPAMQRVVAQSDCRLTLMHSLSVPANARRTLPEDADPVTEIILWAEGRASELAALGIARERLVLDPGIGFGKTPAQSFMLLKRIDELRIVRLPLLIGHSRKSFLRTFTDGEPQDRDAATLAVSAYLTLHSVAFLRVHAVAAHAEAQRILQALHG